MKFYHLLPVLAVAAAFGAVHALPGSSSHALALPAPPELAAVVPPWLAHEASDGDADAVGAVVAHAAFNTHDDAHAALHGEDPHAHYGGDPHAGLYAGEDDPHAGLYAAGDDPHAALHGGAPHTSVYPPAEPDGEDPYQRVGLEPPREVSVAKLERSLAANGRSVAEVFASRATLAGQKVRVRGTVVKLNEGILGKTYLHLQDGSGGPERGDHDLTVTTTGRFELGETVEVEGVLAVDQDVGAGYRYEALLGEATRVAPAPRSGFGRSASEGARRAPSHVR